MTHFSADTLSVQNPPEGPATSSVRWIVLFGVWGTYFCFGLTIAGLAPLIEPITRDLGISHTAMGGVLGVWQLVYIAAAVPCGTLLDRIGTRRALFLGALIIAASGFLRGIADSALMLYLAVGLFGVGGRCSAERRGHRALVHEPRARHGDLHHRSEHGRDRRSR